MTKSENIRCDLETALKCYLSSKNCSILLPSYSDDNRWHYRLNGTTCRTNENAVIITSGSLYNPEAINALKKLKVDVSSLIFERYPNANDHIEYAGLVNIKNEHIPYLINRIRSEMKDQAIPDDLQAVFGKYSYVISLDPKPKHEMLNVPHISPAAYSK